MTRRSRKERIELNRAAMAQLESKTEEQIKTVRADAAARIQTIRARTRARVARLKETAQERRNVLRARTGALEARQATRSRQDDTRRKILLGSMLLLSVDRSDKVGTRRRAWVRSKLPGFLSRSTDADLFPDLLGTGLPTPNSPKQDARRRILLGSLIVANLDTTGVREWLATELPGFLKPTDRRLFADILPPEREIPPSSSPGTSTA